MVPKYISVPFKRRSRLQSIIEQLATWSFWSVGLAEHLRNAVIGAGLALTFILMKLAARMRPSRLDIASSWVGQDRSVIALCGVGALIRPVEK